MTDQRQPVSAEFPERVAIDQKAFALRHAIYEEIKHRRAAAPLNAAELKTLEIICGSLSVELLPRREGYLLSLDGLAVSKVPYDAVRFYVRGDKTPAGSPGGEDAVLRENLRQVSAIVDQLVNEVQKSGEAPSTEKPAEMMFRGVSCVLPCFNEENSLEKSVHALASALDEEISTRTIVGDYEVLIVDDGSTDSSPVIAEQLLAGNRRVRLIRHAANMGYGAALFTGFQGARFDLVFFSNPDGQFDYAQIRELLPLVPFAEVVCGYRQNKQEPWLRTVSAWGWRALVRLFFGRLVRDIDCPFKIFRKTALDKVNLLRIRGRGAIINTELLYRMKQQRLRFSEVPLRYFPRRLKAGPSPEVFARAFFELSKLVIAAAFEKLGWFGFVTGLFSRSDRPVEVLEYRRSEYVMDGEVLSCPLCGADGSRLRKTHLGTCEDIRHLGQYSVYLCVRCRNGFTFPKPPEEASVIAPDTGSDKMSGWQRAVMNWFISIRARRVLAAMRHPAAGTLIDFGAGNCNFANAMAERRFKVAAWELSGANEMFAKDSVQFVAAPINEAEACKAGFTNESVDAITMWHSLEHFPEPKEVLHLALRLLRPGGVLYISVPNLNSLQSELGGQWWTYLDVPHHRVHFSLNGLVERLLAEGFERPAVHWFSPEYDVFGFYQTLLNIFTRSHNYFYNRTKKGRCDQPLRYPRWTKAASVILAPVLLPLSLVLSVWSDFSGKPGCAEVNCYKPFPGGGR